MVWLSVLALVWIIVEPSRRTGEMLHDARKRVAVSIPKDPVFWLFAALLAIALIRFLNSGIGMAYDVENIRWYVSEPAIPFLPGSAEGAGYLPFATVLSAMVLSLGIRHALGKSARISFLMSCSFLAGIAGIAAVVLARYGEKTFLAMIACRTTASSFAGSACGMYTLAAIAALAGASELKWGAAKSLAIPAIGGALAGLWYFAPAPVVLAYVAAAVVLLIASLAYVAFSVSPLAAAKMSAIVVIGVAVSLMFCLCGVPEGLNESRLSMLGGFYAMFPAKFLEARDALCTIASKVWRANPWTGSGLGSFMVDVRFNATASDWNVIDSAQSCALNGWWTLLAERGLVGVLSLGAVLSFVFASFAVRCVRAPSRKVFVPFVALAVAALAALATEAFFDEALRRSDVLLAAFSFICLSAWAFPLRKSQ